MRCLCYMRRFLLYGMSLLYEPFCYMGCLCYIRRFVIGDVLVI